MYQALFPASHYMFKVNNKTTRTRCEGCSELTIKTPKRCHWRLYSVFIVNFIHISCRLDCQRFSPPQDPETEQTVFKSGQMLNSVIVEWNSSAETTATSRGRVSTLFVNSQEHKLCKRHRQYLWWSYFLFRVTGFRENSLGVFEILWPIIW